MYIEKWFATPIMYHMIGGNHLDLVQKQIEKILPSVREMDLKNPWGDGVTTSFKYAEEGAKLFENYDLSGLQTTINELKNIFLDHHGQKNFSKYQIADSWMNFSNRGGFQFEHSHLRPDFDNNILSGVYYYQTTGNDGDIEFISPNPMQAVNLTFFGNSFVNYKPEVGKLIVFPSWLRHRVKLNTTDSERISISFNIAPVSSRLTKISL